MNEIQILLLSTLRLSTPLIFASLGGFFSERSGVVNIALEGKMLVGAFVAAFVCYETKNPYIATLAALFAGALIGLLHGFCCITLRADQIVVGTAINLFVMGTIPLFCKSLFGSVSSTPGISLNEKLEPSSMFVLAVFCAIFAHYIYRKTNFGLHLKAVGDHPKAAYTLGVSVVKVRYLAVMIAGMLASLGGTYLSIAHASGYARNMTSGRGYIALAALIFGKWRPIPAALACLMFGLADALQIRTQGASLFGVDIPVQFIQMIPYLLTIIILAGFMGRANPPIYIGIPWKKN